MPMNVSHHRGSLALGTLLSRGGCQQEGCRVWSRGMCEPGHPPHPPRVTHGVEELPAGNGAPLKWERMLARAASSPLLLLGQNLLFAAVLSCSKSPQGANTPSSLQQRSLSGKVQRDVEPHQWEQGGEFGLQVLPKCQTLLTACFLCKRFFCPCPLGLVKALAKGEGPGLSSCQHLF